MFQCNIKKERGGVFLLAAQAQAQAQVQKQEQEQYEDILTVCCQEPQQQHTPNTGTTVYR